MDNAQANPASASTSEVTVKTPQAEGTTGTQTVTTEVKSAPPTTATVTISEAEIQSRIDAVVTKRLNEEKEKAKQKEQKAREETEARVKAEQGDFKGLYEALDPKHKELEANFSALQERLAERDKAENKRIDAEIKDWHEQVKALDPGPENLEARQAWRDKAAKIQAALVDRAQQPGSPPNPIPVGQSGDSKLEEEARRGQASLYAQY